jgi:hypothetical protein
MEKAMAMAATFGLGTLLPTLVLVQHKDVMLKAN